jgi:hypothetical protein
MKHIKIFGVAMVATVALGAVAVSSASAGLLFIGEPVGALILGHALTNQVFKTAAGKEVVCTEATTHGKIAELRSLFQLVTVNYGGCKAFGQKTTITPAQYLFSADGLVLIENTVTITVEELGFNCKVKVAPQDLQKVSYKNVGTTKLEEVSEVTGITSTTTGGFCGSESKVGTYSGNSELLVDATGGSVQVD